MTKPAWDYISGPMGQGRLPPGMLGQMLNASNLVGCECVKCPCTFAGKASEMMGRTMWLDEAHEDGGGMHIVKVCRHCAKGEHEEDAS